MVEDDSIKQYHPVFCELSHYYSHASNDRPKLSHKLYMKLEVQLASFDHLCYLFEKIQL